jgi:hypothetical protein
MRSPVRHFRDTAQIQAVSVVENPDTAEQVRSWANVATCNCNLVKQVEDRFTDEHPISRATYRLMIPPATKVNGENLSVSDHRIGDITLKDKTVEPGPFRIAESLPRRDRLRVTRFTTLMLERIDQDET